MRVPLKQIIVSVAFIGLAVLLYFAPRGYPGVKKQAEGSTQQQQQHSGEIDNEIAEVKKQLGANQVAKINLFEAQLKSASTPAAKIAALDSLTIQWDKQMRPFIAAHYCFEKSEIINTFAAWYEAGNRFFALSAIIPPDKQDERTAVFGKAGEAYDKALALNPNDKAVRTRAAICKVEGPDPMQGILALRQLVTEDSTNIEAQLNLGMFSLRTTQYDKAEKRFRTVIALDPAYKDGYWYLAGALEGQNRIDEAINYYKEYIKRNKDNSAENEEIEKYIVKLKSKK